MNTKKVAFYLGDFKRSGGTERACIAVANGIGEFSDHQVFLITTNSQAEESFFEIGPKVNIIYLNINNLKGEYFLLAKRLKSSLKEYKIDILIAVEVMSIIFLLSVFVSKIIGMTGIKLFVWEHFNFTVSLNKKMRVYLRKFAARFADTIIVLTQKDVELWKTNLKVRAKIISINNPSPFPISNNKYKEESTTVIAVGRLKYQKGFDRLLKIWSDFKRIRPNGLWKLQIIGSGPEADKLKEQSMRLGIGSSVEWIENTAHIKRYYENAAFLAMTSRFEGLPMTLIEAQSFGLPIIAYDCLTGPGEVISKKSGFLIRNGDDDEFVDKLLLLSQDSSLRNRFSYSAREEVTKFSVRNIVMQWLSLLAK